MSQTPRLDRFCPSVSVQSPLGVSPSQSLEMNLLYAILNRALLDVRANMLSPNDTPFKRLTMRHDALKWFSDDSEEPWSFLWLCEVLDLPVASIRAAVDSTVRDWPIALV